MDVVVLTGDREKQWEEFVRRYPDTMLAHSVGWRNVVSETYRHAPFYLMALEDGRVAGVLPLFLIRSRLFGSYVVTAPYLSYGGLYADHEAAGDTLVRAAQKIVLREGARYLEIRGLKKVDRGVQLKDKYCTYLLPLDPASETVWKRLEKRARETVRKAIRARVTVERGRHLVGDFTAVARRLMRDLGTPFHEEGFYRNILKQFGDDAEIFMVRHGDEFVGGGLTVTINGALVWPYGGCLRGSRRLGAMNLLAWEIIAHGCKQGSTCLDFGRSQWDSGTALFKRQWGAEPHPLFYEYYLPGGTQMPDMDPNNPKFRLPIAVWKRLPLPIVKALGPHIIRGLA